MNAKDWLGFSEISLEEAIKNAYAEAGEDKKLTLVETKSTQPQPNKRLYAVRLQLVLTD